MCVVVMPLLKNKMLDKEPIPKGLPDDKEVFHCEMTNEIFLDYEEFAERTILCNSMVWTCALTGKSNLTYMEAIQSEDSARKSLRDFPVELHVPVLLVAGATKRTGFLEMMEDVYTYVKDRFFVGENVEACFSNRWKNYHVLQVIFEEEKKNEQIKSNGDITTTCLKNPAPSLYKYDVEELDNEDEDVVAKMIVGFPQIRRRRGLFSRDKVRVFLKQHMEQASDGNWVVKNNSVEKFGIDRCKFDTIFNGPQPIFEVSKKFEKTAINGKKVRQETLGKYLTNLNGKPSAFIEKMRNKEFEKSRKSSTGKVKTEDEKKRQKKQLLKVYKNWQKPKEDLLLEDHKPLPVPMKIKSQIPERQLGDVFMILEFVHGFSKILQVTEFFRLGVSFEIIERALTKQEITGPLVDLIQMLLCAIFKMQDDEISVDYYYVSRRMRFIPINQTMLDLTKYATYARQWIYYHQGVALKEFHMNPLTISEILRLHLLMSGARIKFTEKTLKWYNLHRGSYSAEDDPAIDLRQNRPQLIHMLSTKSIVELNMEEKLEIVSCLVNQLLTYASIRDVIEDQMQSSRELRSELRNVQHVEKKRSVEFISTRAKLKQKLKRVQSEDASELVKLEMENEMARVEYEKNFTKLSNKSGIDYQVMLGYDRAHRMYTKLESVPGIFVNYCRIDRDCFQTPVKHIPSLIGVDQDQFLMHLQKNYSNGNGDIIENESVKTEYVEINDMSEGEREEYKKTCERLYMCTTDPSDCPVHHKNHTWGFLHKSWFDDFTNSLNKRGIRESELFNVMEGKKESLKKLVTATPYQQLNPELETDDIKTPKKGKDMYRDANFGYSNEMKPSDILKDIARESILELEEKVTLGYLGSLKVKDRLEWRNCLVKDNYDNFDRTIVRQTENVKSSIKVEDDASQEDPPDWLKNEYAMDPGRTLVIDSVKCNPNNTNDTFDVKDFPNEQTQDVEILTIALAQVAHSVQPKFLKKPLGECEDLKKKQIKRNILENWEASLLHSTSYSQILLHYSMLDSCIMWARSALLARCLVCRRQSDSQNMLICENCNNGLHLYCHKPILEAIPPDEWYCYKCKENKLIKEEAEKTENITTKKRRAFKDEKTDDEEETTDEQADVQKPVINGVNGVADNDIVDDESVGVKIEICITCGSGGELIDCEKCLSYYHIECVEPPLRRKPRCRWRCNKCKEIKDNHRNGHDERDSSVAIGLISSRRLCATRAKHRIHRFIKSLRDGNSDKNYDSDSSVEVSPTLRRSGRKEAADLPLHNAALHDLLKDIMTDSDGWPFVRPVQKNEVPDYYDVIAKPMDFGTIKYKLNMGNYSCDEEFMSDVCLIFDNCNTYNDSEAEVYKCGMRLLKLFEEKCKVLGLKIPKDLRSFNEDMDTEVVEMREASQVNTRKRRRLM